MVSLRQTRPKSNAELVPSQRVSLQWWRQLTKTNSDILCYFSWMLTVLTLFWVKVVVASVGLVLALIQTYLNISSLQRCRSVVKRKELNEDFCRYSKAKVDYSTDTVLSVSWVSEVARDSWTRDCFLACLSAVSYGILCSKLSKKKT